MLIGTRNFILNLKIKMTFYLDSNVFIFAAISNDSRAEKAKALIKEVILGKLSATTSSLTIDEVVWKIWKETKNRSLAIEEGLRILQFDNLSFVNISDKIMLNSLNLMKDNINLKPRDAIHLAAALSIGAQIIVSDDSDFDGLKEIKRKSLD